MTEKQVGNILSVAHAERLVRLLNKRWLGTGLSAEADWAITKLVLSAHIAELSGHAMIKSAAAGALGVEDARTARKYISLAEQRGLVVTRRSADDARRDVILASEAAVGVLGNEFRAVATLFGGTNYAAPHLHNAPPNPRLIFEHPSHVSQANSEAGKLVEAFVADPATGGDKALTALQNGKVPLAADVSWLLRTPESWLADLDVRWGARDEEPFRKNFAVETFRELFLRPAKDLTTIKIAPGGAHPGYPGRFHPDDLHTARVLSAICRALKPRRPTEIRGPLGATDFSGTLILLGGPNSNVLTRLVLQYKKLDESGWNFERVPNPALNVRFHGICDTRAFPPGPNKTIWDWPFYDRWRGQYMRAEYNKDTTLKTNYLLISVLPNILDPAPHLNERIVIFDGLHGVGTAAVELLAQDANLMRRIQDKIGDRDGWQVLLKISEIDSQANWPRPLAFDREYLEIGDVAFNLHAVRALRSEVVGRSQM